MSLHEETIDAALDANGLLQLSRTPQLPPGRVRVTIRPVPVTAKRGLADVLREIAAGQLVRGFPGRSAEEIRAFEAARFEEDEGRDRQLEAARGDDSAGEP